MKYARLFALAEQRRGAIIKALHREITNEKCNKSMKPQKKQAPLIPPELPRVCTGPIRL